MDTKREDLTAAEHVERAQSQGQTVAEYCRQTGHSPHALYSARRQLRKNGALPGSSNRRRSKRKVGKFLAVSVAESAPSVVCRVRHRNGWVIECASWPLWSKRIESAEKYHWPRLLAEEVVTMTTEQLNWLLDGYDIWTQPHRMLKFQHAS